MKENISDKIKFIPFVGTYNYLQTKRFKDENFSSKENMFQYHLCKIHIFLGEKNKILGIQSFYKNTKNEEIPGQLGYDESLKTLNLMKLEIPSNDHLCNMHIFRGDEGVKQIKFVTYKGKELTVGEGGEDTKMSFLNSNKENIILSISGGYNQQLELLGCRYINMSDYFGHTLGYFELRMKMKNENFQNKILSNMDKYKDSDQVLIKVCLLPESCFNEIIQFCMK